MLDGRRSAARGAVVRALERDGTAIPNRDLPLRKRRQRPGPRDRCRFHVLTAREPGPDQHRPRSWPGQPDRQRRIGFAVPQVRPAHHAQRWVHEHGPHRRRCHAHARQSQSGDGGAEGSRRVVRHDRTSSHEFDRGDSVRPGPCLPAGLNQIDKSCRRLRHPLELDRPAPGNSPLRESHPVSWRTPRASRPGATRPAPFPPG